MLPPKEGDSLLVQSPVYAQIFLSHNGQRCSKSNIKFKILPEAQWTQLGNGQVMTLELELVHSFNR